MRRMLLTVGLVVGLVVNTVDGADRATSKQSAPTPTAGAAAGPKQTKPPAGKQDPASAATEAIRKRAEEIKAVIESKKAEAETASQEAARANQFARTKQAEYLQAAQKAMEADMKVRMKHAELQAAISQGELMAKQPPAKPSSAPRPAVDVVLIDLAAAFKKYPHFKDRIAKLKADMLRAEQTLKQDRNALRPLREKLKGQRAGTPEYKRLEGEIAKASADLDTRFQLEKTEFTKKEADIYLRSYREIQKEVDVYARSHGIAEVLKFSGSGESEAAKPEEVPHILNQPVIWHDRKLDITPIIVESLNRRAPHAHPGPIGSASPAQR